jgi:hypothetical protein
MKPNVVLVTMLILAFATIAIGQTVVITPKRTVYRRPKPMMDFKKTFVIRRAVAKASTSALSRKITSVISPESVLQLNVKEELGENQWVEEADYRVIYNKNGLLSIKLWMEGTAAYPDTVTKYIVVDLALGKNLERSDVFQNLPFLAAMIRTSQRAEVESATEEMKKDPESKDFDSSQLFEQVDFKAEDIREFSVSETGITFYYDYGFPHAIQALQPSGEFLFSWSRLKPFIKPGGLLARFIR